MPISGAIAQLRTRDLDASIRFYTERLGMTLAFRHEDFYAGIRSGAQVFHLKQADAPDPSIAYVDAGDHFHLYVQTDDAVATADAFATRGVPLARTVHETPWGTREFVIHDDQGHTLYFGQPLDAADTVAHDAKDAHADRVVDLKAFVPAKDHELAKRFYTDLGFRLNWGNDQVAEFEIGSFRFLLQNFHAPHFAENFMMHLMVDDADAWWTRIQQAGLADKYPGITLKPPTLQPWGLRVLYVSDPTGVLWHIADRRSG